MTVELFDLAQRLHAASSGCPVARLSHAPLLPVRRPVAVRAWRSNGSIKVAAVVPDAAVTTASGRDALDLLHGMGVRMSADSWATLVTDDESTLPLLMDLAYGNDGDDEYEDAAAHIAWWGERSDFPGSTAVVPLVPLCRTRWVTGETPHAESSAQVWRRWLKVLGDDCSTLLDLLALVSDGRVLPGLDAVANDDDWSWSFAQREHADGQDWRGPDSVSRAATGLRERCDAADLYDAALLADPLWCRRALHTGHVSSGRVTGGLTGFPATAVGVACDRFATRLKSQSKIVGWAGYADGRQLDGQFSGTVLDIVVVDGELVLVLSVVAARRPVSGARVSVRAAPPSPEAMKATRARYRRLYSARRSWLTTGRAPVTSRRDVPLDVFLAASE
ncbi:hypothetical protein ACFV9C_42925 [Kribbella sp. NPDC059898]|uniref:hypothetical protein n=1 Tax=Kribbella sp. NPDC059898 TaxID=3346995 RepID=UPI0036668C38